MYRNTYTHKFAYLSFPCIQFQANGKTMKICICTVHGWNNGKTIFQLTNN